jgi:putative phosphoesterase
MRVAVVSDVHGNLPALEAVLAEIEREEVGLVVSGGDVAMGPMPAECVDALLALDRVVWVRGNADREAVPERYTELARWVAERLGPERQELVAGAPLTAAVDVDGLGSVLCFHGTPRSDEEILTKLSPDQRVAEALDGVEQRVVVHGHTHVQYDRQVAGRRIVNAGSVGMPYEGRQGAFWALLGPDVELRRTEYDVEDALAAIRATGYPAVDELTGWLLEPPDPDEISTFFEGQAAGA